MRAARLTLAIFLAGCTGFHEAVSHPDLSASDDLSAANSDGGRDAAPNDSSVADLTQASTDLTGVDLAQHLPAAKQLALGAQHSCALLTDGTVACWGDNGAGQLGLGAAGGAQFSPVRVVGLANVMTLAGGGGGHTCALLGDRTVRCWGDNTYGQIGGGTVIPAPSEVPGLGTVDALFVGPRNTCVIQAGHLSCWGDDTSSQVGDGKTQAITAPPTQVAGLSTVITAGLGGQMDAFHTCAVALDTLYCWGSNVLGELGDGSAGGPHASPGPVALAGVKSLSLGKYHTCALSVTQPYCWGDETQGALGSGPTAHLTPSAVNGCPPASAVVTGTYHTCALLIGETLACWGRNLEGQLGVGDTDPHNTPTAVPLLTNLAQVAAGALHTCALTTAGDVYCWGWNRNGQLGDGKVMDRPSPALVAWP